MKSLDLFSGAGGLTRGMHDAGWVTIAAVERDPAAMATYQANFPQVQPILGDIDAVSFTSWRGRVDLVAGGPPCQPFSVAGLQQSGDDPRDCVPHFIRVVAEVRPEAFLMENVAGLMTPRHRGYLANVIERLESIGYQVVHEILDAAQFGVPQHRNRLFIVGIQGKAFQFPEPTHGPGRQWPYCTSGAAIANAPDDQPNTAIISYAKKPVLRPQPFDGMLVNGGGRPINLQEPSQTIPASAGGNRTHIVDPEGILIEYHAELMDGSKPRRGLVEGVRRLTVSESGALQSFPDEHQFLGTQSARYRQVGNAVPPLLAQRVSEALAQQIGIQGA